MCRIWNSSLGIVERRWRAHVDNSNQDHNIVLNAANVCGDVWELTICIFEARLLIARKSANARRRRAAIERGTMWKILIFSNLVHRKRSEFCVWFQSSASPKLIQTTPQAFVAQITIRGPGFLQKDVARWSHVAGVDVQTFAHVTGAAVFVYAT